MIRCARMSQASAADARALLGAFLRDDAHYRASAGAYGDGGGAALDRALALFLARPEIGFVWLAYAQEAVQDMAVGACVVCRAISTSRGSVVAKLDDVTVHPDWQGRGVGGAMLAATSRSSARGRHDAHRLRLPSRQRRRVALLPAARVRPARRGAPGAALLTNRIVVLVAAAGGGTRFGSADAQAIRDARRAARHPSYARAPARDAASTRCTLPLAPDDRDSIGCANARPTFASFAAAAKRARRPSPRALDVLAADYDGDDWIAVHDAARPCVPTDALTRLIETARWRRCRRPSRHARRRHVEARRSYSRTRRMSLPRCPARGCGRRRRRRCSGSTCCAARSRRNDAMRCTDESQSVEALGLAPRLVRGSAANIKITFPEDLDARVGDPRLCRIAHENRHRLRRARAGRGPPAGHRRA